tara:strand:- start:70 stop:279 length:210 start_codon:yes stop_codon:yes gene_type:complete
MHFWANKGFILKAKSFSPSDTSNEKTLGRTAKSRAEAGTNLRNILSTIELIYQIRSRNRNPPGHFEWLT